MGLKAAADMPRRRNSVSSAAVTCVLPTAVSVPVMKRFCFIHCIFVCLCKRCHCQYRQQRDDRIAEPSVAEGADAERDKVQDDNRQEGKFTPTPDRTAYGQ